MSSLVTAALTAFFGVIVFVSGQLLQRFVFEPILEQRKIIGEIAYSLLYHANVMDVSRVEPKLVQVEEPLAAVRYLRSLGGRLRATLWAIPFYGLLSALGVVPKRKAIMTASSGLVGWSNSIHSGATHIHRKNIAQSLRLPDE